VVSASQIEVAGSETGSSRASDTKAGQVSGAIFQVRPEGLSRKLWSSSDEMPFSLIFDKSRERIIFATATRAGFMPSIRMENTNFLPRKYRNNFMPFMSLMASFICSVITRLFLAGFCPKGIFPAVISVLSWRPAGYRSGGG